MLGKSKTCHRDKNQSKKCNDPENIFKPKKRKRLCDTNSPNRRLPARKLISKGATTAFLTINFCAAGRQFQHGVSRYAGRHKPRTPTNRRTEGPIQSPKLALTLTRASHVANRDKNPCTSSDGRQSDRGARRHGWVQGSVGS